VAVILFHPTLLARRAAEIARTQGGKLERDACGRPFVVPAADPLAEPPAERRRDPMRFAWLIRVIWALGRVAGPRMGRPVAGPR
jgi:hypothetical protein